MIETTNEQAKQAADIVLGAMRTMDICMRTYAMNTTLKIDCANAIARLAAILWMTEVRKDEQS